MRILERAKCWTFNRLGWKFDHPILVIESDDWAMIRMGGSCSQQRLRQIGYPVDECPFNRVDNLETADDLQMLAEVLQSVRDINGRPAVLTANMVMANPDFDKIRESHFTQYFYIPFDEGLRSSVSPQTVEVYRQMALSKLIRPQLHGREHTSVERWLAALRKGDSRFIDAFNEGMYTVHPGGMTVSNRDCLDALGLGPDDVGFPDLHRIIDEAQKLFIKFWGEPSVSFIAPCYAWHPQTEKILAKVGVKYLQGSRVQRVPVSGWSGSYRRVYHFTGQRNQYGQRYLVRNVELEPTISGNESSCINKAIVETKAAFDQSTPAIVSSHRLNYMGSIDPHNRDQGLRVLRSYLQRVVKLWPNVEFLSSDELGYRMDV